LQLLVAKTDLKEDQIAMTSLCDQERPETPIHLLASSLHSDLLIPLISERQEQHCGLDVLVDEPHPNLPG